MGGFPEEMQRFKFKSPKGEEKGWYEPTQISKLNM